MHQVRQLGLILGAMLLVGTFAAPAARAGVNCTRFSSWCPSIVMDHAAPTGDHSTPEPGALGLLALGAAVGIARMRPRKK